MVTNVTNVTKAPSTKQTKVTKPSKKESSQESETDLEEQDFIRTLRELKAEQKLQLEQEAKRSDASKSRRSNVFAD